MFKTVFFCFIVIFIISTEAQEVAGALECYNGTAVYFMNGTIETTLYLSRTGCSPEEICGGYSWINEDDKGYRRIVETRFCTRYNVTDCRYLDGQPDVGNISECVPQTCSEHLCNDFNGSVCDVGSLVYTTDMALVVLDFDASVAVCSVGETCAMYRFLNFDYENNYQSYVEYGRCVSTNATASCSDLKEIDVIGMVSNCSVDNCSESGCPVFSKQIPPQPWYSCDQGTFVYSAETGAIVFTENISHDPCSSGQACWMARFINEDGGVSHYVESGECVNVSLISYYNCDAIKMSNDTENVTSCSTISCSGDYCVRFSPLQPQPGCPARANNDDIQILPGCTLRQGLKKVFSCFEEIGSDYPYSNEDNCSAAFDRMVQCLSQVAQDCIAISENGTLCPSVLNFLGTESISQILKAIRTNAIEVDDINSLVETLNQNFPGVGNVVGQELLSICSDGNGLDLESAISNLSLLLDLNLRLGHPVCSDNRVLRNLVQWSVRFLESVQSTDSTSEICLAFNQFKAEIENAIITRCYELNTISEILEPLIGEYFSNLVQNAVDIAKYFLRDLQLPGCEDFINSTHLACQLGAVVYSLDKRVVYFEENASVEVCPLFQGCGMLRWNNTDELNRSSYIEFGFCNNLDSNITCENIIGFPDIANVSDCEREICFESYCAVFTRDICEKRGANEIPLLPRCSLNESLSRLFNCFEQFFIDYPYRSTALCRERFGFLTPCVVGALTDCISGNCDFILDGIIPELRDLFQNFHYFTEGPLTTFEQIIEVLGGDAITSNMIISEVCREPGSSGTLIASVIRPALQELVELVRYFDPGRLCGGPTLVEILEHGINSLFHILNVRTQQDVCNALSSFISNVTKQWNNNCLMNSLKQEVARVFRSFPSRFRSAVVKAIPIFNQFLTEYGRELNCSARNVTLPDCSRFYLRYDSCSTRQAWLCDYITWRIEYLGQWLPEFKSYVNQNNPGLLDICPKCLSVPPCTYEDQRRCVSAPDGCTICYCMDQQYNDLSEVVKIFTMDWQAWRGVFRAYRSVLQSTETCNIP